MISGKSKLKLRVLCPRGGILCSRHLHLFLSKEIAATGVARQAAAPGGLFRGSTSKNGGKSKFKKETRLMRYRGLFLIIFLLIPVACGGGGGGAGDETSQNAPSSGAGTNSDTVVLAFNDLGMHCLDREFCKGRPCEMQSLPQTARRMIEKAVVL